MNAIDDAVTACHAAGYQDDGETAITITRMVTATSYPLPGAEVRSGGRRRLALPGRVERVTIGKVTTNFYRSDNERAGFKQFRTKDTPGIAAEAANRARALQSDAAPAPRSPRGGPSP